MATLSLPRDERGAVYVEFLLAFLPVFLLFLAICQVGFLVAGRLVVSHAALVGARSAIVVLDDDPTLYGGAERNYLSDKPSSKPQSNASDPLAAISQALSAVAPASLGTSSSEPSGPKSVPQQGARMQAIRAAVFRPLGTVAPTASAFLGGAGATVEASLAADAGVARAFAKVYVQAAAVVTVHDSPKHAELANEPIGPNAPVTVRVTFLQMCGIPVVRALMCRSISSLLEEPEAPQAGMTEKRQALRARLQHAAAPGWLEAMAAKDSRFVVVEAQVTLPNQGAAYAYASKSDDQTPSL